MTSQSHKKLIMINYIHRTRLESFVMLCFILTTYWLGVIFYDLIQIKTSFSYIDELLVLFLLILYIVYSLPKTLEVSKSFIYFIFIAIFYLVYSLTIHSNITNAILSDFIIVIKSFLVFFLIREINIGLNNNMKLLLMLNAIIGLFVIIFLQDMSHPSRFATAIVATGLLYIYAGEYSFKNILIFILIMAIGLLSFRSKMYGFFALSSILIFYFYKNYNFKFSLKHIIYTVIIVLLLAVLTYEKIYFYFYYGVVHGHEIYARPQLYITSFQIAKDYFPFGSGFASFASHFSGVYYSDIYAQYAIDTTHGLAEGGTDNFISDSFFPQLLGQFGFFGFFLFIYVGYYILKSSYLMYKYNPSTVKYFFIIISIVSFFVIESLVDSTFVQNRGVFIVILLSMSLNEMQKIIEIKNNIKANK